MNLVLQWSATWNEGQDIGERVLALSAMVRVESCKVDHAKPCHDVQWENTVNASGSSLGAGPPLPLGKDLLTLPLGFVIRNFG